MDLLFRHFWIAFIVVTVANGRAWWSRAEARIRSHPELESGYRRLYRGYLVWMNVPWLLMGLGIVTGGVPTVFDFLRPSEGNPFVLAWWGLMAGLLCLGTWWIFVAGGAETLERHPGVYMVPQWSAAKLRLFWLGLVAWNVAIGTVLFLGGPGTLHKPGNPWQQDSWLRPLFPLLFVGLLLLVSLVLSAAGGWRALAQKYAAHSAFSGTLFRFRSGQLSGYVNYGSCLTLGASQYGLYLAVFPIFRMGHPPLLIPWSDVTARDARSWLSEAVELEFAKVPGATLRVSRRLAQGLLDASGSHVLVQPAS